MGNCEWEKLKGTGWGHDEPAIFRCIWSRCEDIYPKCLNKNGDIPCCDMCKCTCSPDEDDEEENFTYSSETSGTGTYYGSEEKGGT